MNPCPYCVNRERDVCSPCREQGKFTHFAPEVLKDWEIPHLPPYHEIAEMDAYQVRACFYLVLHYLTHKIYEEGA